MEKLQLKCKGLYTFPNPLGVPQGALLQASNGVIDRDDTFETRRGLKQYGTTLVHPFQAMYNFNSTLMGWDGTNFWFDSDSAGTWEKLDGNYIQPSDTYRIKGIQAQGTMYFGTSTGIISLTAPTSSFLPAGVPFPLESIGTANPTVGGFMANSTTVGYRMVLGYTDSNNQLHLSAPSQRLVVTNSSGSAATVQLTWYIPPHIPDGYFYQIYRTKQTAFVTGLAQDPGDEEYLVIQKTLTTADTIAQSIAYNDNTPDTLLGTSLYTNPSQQTIAGANYSPPLAKDMVYYKNNMLYANTLTKQQVVINMIATPTIGDTITIGGATFTAHATEIVTNGYFQVYTTGTVAQNIDNTARDLVHVINSVKPNGIDLPYIAIYTSGYTSLPGQITLQERSIGGSAFTITASVGTVYSPQIPTSGVTYTSTNNINTNYVYVSKNQIPDAVPLGNYIPVGTSDKAILRILALRDSVFVFKEDGIYRILGTDVSNFSVSLFDSTVILTALDSAVLLNNQIFCFSNQGVVAVSDSGTVILSRPIERDLITLSSSIYPNFASSTFGIRYESDRHYMLGMNTNVTDTVATQFFVYNILTQCWTNWPITATAGIVSIEPDDHLYLMESAASLVARERKDWTNFDFADFQYPVTITGSSGLTVNVNSTTDALAGYTLYQEDVDGNVVGKSIIATVVNATTLLMEDEANWVNGAATLYQPIAVNMEYAPVGQDFSWVNLFGDFLLFFREDSSFTNLQIGFSCDLNTSVEYTIISPILSDGFGIGPFGDGPWGGTTTIAEVVRTKVPRNMCRSHWLRPSIVHAEALSNFALTGICAFYRPISSRQK